MHPENIHRSPQGWPDLSLLPAKSLISGLRTTDHLQAFPPPSAMPRDTVPLAGQGGLQQAAGTGQGHPPAQAQLCPGDAVLRQQTQGRRRWEKPIIISCAGIRAGPARRARLQLCFFTALPTSFACVSSPLPHLVSMPRTHHRVSDQKGSLSPAYSSPHKRPLQPQTQPLSPKTSALGSSATFHPRGGGTSRGWLKWSAEQDENIPSGPWLKSCFGIAASS